MLYIIDLFCGAGGLSLGAKWGGHSVVFAVDDWAEAIKLHQHYHPEPGCKHVTQSLGDDVDVWVDRCIAATPRSVELGVDTLHIHASPPCQNLSSSNVKRDVAKGLFLVKWTLRLFFQLKMRGHVPFSWSLEQVPHKQLKALLDKDQVAWRTFQMNLYGVPQTRSRTIAVSHPAILDSMQLQPSADWRTFVSIPDEARYVSGSVICAKRIQLNNTVFLSQRKDITTTTTTYTVTSKLGSLYLGEDGRCVGRMTLEDYVALQTFPRSYFEPLGPGKRGSTVKMNANAIPPVFAKVLLDAVVLAQTHD